MVLIRKKSNSLLTLSKSLITLANLLETQKEPEAAADLVKASSLLESQTEEALNMIMEAFEGDHELIAYTFNSNKEKEHWDAADELFMASTNVLNLTKRLKASS